MDVSLRARAVQTALGVEIFNVTYNIAEGILALGLGILAASISLETFGLDSLIEVTAGVILIWRLRAEQNGGAAEKIERVEQRAERFVGITLLALAVYVVIQSGYALWTREIPEASGWGIALAVASLVIMPLIARWKLRLAEQIPSRALRADAFETIACAYLSFTLLLGLAANYFLGWWWADPLAALVMVYFIVREARAALANREMELGA
jgi:divalent metal cation (Fe/Co/Zn/Cd) transporter